jgi:hypothetical protein
MSLIRFVSDILLVYLRKFTMRLQFSLDGFSGSQMSHAAGAAWMSL